MIIQQKINGIIEQVLDKWKQKFGDSQLNSVTVSCLLSNRIKNLCNGKIVSI